MRHILIDRARDGLRAKRGAGALGKLERVDPQLGRLVEWRFRRSPASAGGPTTVQSRR